jgi:hypothetical protein
MINKIRHELFCIKWLWKNRKWKNTRQKYKTMEKDWERKINND